MHFLSLSPAEFWLIPLVIIPIIAIALRYIFPIRVIRILVSKHFSYWVLGYVVVSIWAIYKSSSCDLSPMDCADALDSIGNYAWNHFLAPGTSINGRVNVSYYRIIDILGVFIFNVLLLTTIINSLSRLREKWKAGRIYYNFSLYGCFKRNNVTVVLGNHDSGFEIVRQCLAREGINKPKYILVLLDGDIDEYRSKMMSAISRKDIKKVIFCRGDLTSRLDLLNIHIEKASEVFIIGNGAYQNERMSVHDAECIKCIRLLRDNGDKNGEAGIVTAFRRPGNCLPLVCRVFFEYQTSYSVFQTADIGGKETRPIKGEDDKRMRVLIFKPVNFYEQSCEKVIACPASEDSYYIPIDGKNGIKEDSDSFVHLIIVGQTQMGTTLAIEAAHLFHFPNFHRKENGKRIGPRTRITFIDKEADVEKDHFTGRLKELFELSPWRYRDMSAHQVDSGWIDPMDNVKSQFNDGHIGKDFMDVEWEFIKGDIASLPIKDYLISSVRDTNAKCTIAICFHDQNESVAAAQYLPEEVCLKAQEVLVYQAREGSVIDEMVKYDTSGRFSNFRSFGTIGNFYDDRFCNELESEFDKSLAVFQPSQPMSKSQIACWWSERYRELTTWIKIRSFGQDYEDIDLESFSKVEHSRWNMEQLLLGFRPLTKDEQDYVLSTHTEVSKKEAKDKLKGKKAHLDICSYESLHRVDPSVIDYDTPRHHHSIKDILSENYIPRPLNTNMVNLPEEISQLTEFLAEKVHEKWMDKRKNDGWTYGARRSDSRKEHPCLVPYSDLPESEKEYDRNTSTETLKALISLGYSFCANGEGIIATSDKIIQELSGQLAKNVHEVWALNRKKEGWSFGPERDDANRKHPCLIPYGLLSDSEKAYDKDTAVATLEAIRSAGYSITALSDAVL